MTQDMVKMMSQDKMIGKREILSSSPSPWFSRFLRTMLLLLMMTLGVSEMSGQTTDYSGTYYLANNNKGDYKGYDKADNFYLCAALEYYDNGTITTTENATPFLTTYKTRQTEQSLWIVEKVGNTNYYTFKQKEGNHYRYLTVNDAIPSLGDGKKHRRRVHLEEFSTTQLTNRNYFTFTQITTHQDGVIGYSIGCHSDYVVATGKGYLNPPSGNFNQKTASNNDSGGIVGFFTIGTIDGDGRGSVWFFEVPKPIMHIDGNNQLSFTCADEDVTYRCTIDIAADPTTSDAVYTNTTLTEGVHTIKVIAVNANGYASGVVTYKTRVFSSEHPYLISNNQSPWTVESENQYIYYMIPSDVDNSNNTTVNTTSMPRPSMEWYIDFAEEVNGERYFNFRNAKTGGFLYRTGTTISMKTSSEKTSLEEGDDNGFKFYLIERTDGYSIVPYGETTQYLNKDSGNNSAKSLNIGTNNNANSWWNFAVKTDLIADLNSTLPFAPSDETSSVYYKIKNGQQTNNNDYYIIPPAAADGNATASKDATESSMSWYFVQVQAPTDNDWLTYYKIINAETGKALYYNYVNNSNCLKTGDYEDNNGNYMFAFVKSPTTDYYHIVPKTCVNDQQVANIYTIYRDNANIKPATTRAAGNNSWTFTPATLFCNDPEFVEEEGIIKIKCNTNAAKIYINTESDANPTNESTLYDPTDPENVDTQNWETTDQVRIKAIAVVSDGTNTASSSVFTLLNNPDITLGGTAPYFYNASPWEPGVTEVSIGEASNKTSSTSGYSIAYSENHTDAGEVSVTVTDNVEDDLFIKNASTTFTIQRKGVTITASNDSKPYDGEPLMESGFTAGDLETGDTHTFTVAMTAESTITDAGTQPNEIATVDGVSVTTGTETVVGNYLVTTANGTLTVSPASVTLTANSRNTDVYDGTEKTVTGFTCKLGEQTVDGLNFEGVSASGSGTNAGDYDVTFTGVTVNETKDNTGNYVVIGTTVGTLTIKPASVTLIANSRNTDVYDGTEKTVTGFICKMGEQTVEGLAFAESVAASGSGTNAGEYDVTFTGVTLNETKDNTGNYIVTGTTDGTLTITAKEITISGITAENKEYDGTTDAVLVYTGVTFTGKLDGDILTVTATGTFEDKNVGTGKTVSITGFTFGGTGAANYTYNGGDLAATANIIAKGLTITGGISGVDKEYDGTTAADLDFSGATFDGKITGDDLSASGTGTFEDKEVGAGKTVTITRFGLTLSGADAGNYELAASGHQETTTATINVKTVTISGITASDKTYDGTTDATLDCTNPTIVGVVEGENLTVVATGATGAFDTKDVGTDKTVTISGLAIDGTNVSNYVLSAEAPTTTAKITQAELTVTAKDKSITYGDAIVTNDGVEYGVDDGNGGTTNNFVNGEGENVLGGTLAYAYGKTENETFTEYTAGNDAGYYDIVISGLTSVNYHINFVKGTLTVNAKEIGNGGITPNDGFTISFDEGNNIIVKDGETELTEDNGDITIEGPTLSASGRYSVTSVNGRNNYGGSVKIKYAITNFMNDGDDGTEWSATFVAEEDHALPDGISAYLITAIIGNEVTATPLDYIPGGVPVLLLSGADVDGFKVKAPTTYTEITDEQRGANKLKEVTADEEFPTAKIYLLYYNEFVLNMQGTLAAGKVYMLNPDYAPAPAPARLVIRWHQDTGIEDSTLQDKGRETNDKWYAFDGRRLNGKPTRKGLYIKNGQKTVIK